MDQMYISTLLIDLMAIWSIELLIDWYTLYGEFLHGCLAGGSGINIMVGADVVTDKVVGVIWVGVGPKM